MRKYVILFVVSVLFMGAAQAYTVDRYDRVLNASYGDCVPKSSINKLNEIENSLYGKVYADQELLARIERLENTVYNRYYPSYPIDQRLNNLIYNYNYGARNRLARTNRLRRIVDSINSTFVGVPTGFTPPINDPYYDDYGYGNYYYGTNGVRYRNTRINTGSGIRILD